MQSDAGAGSDTQGILGGAQALHYSAEKKSVRDRLGGIVKAAATSTTPPGQRQKVRMVATKATAAGAMKGTHTQCYSSMYQHVHSVLFYVD